MRSVNPITTVLYTFQHTLKRKLGVSTGLALVTLCLFSTAVFADGTITVTTVDDEFDTGSSNSCSLREAIETANTGSDFGGCTVEGDGADSYNLVIPVPDEPGPYMLTLAGANEDRNATGDLDIRASMNIVGHGEPELVIIEAGASSNHGIDRVFHITTDDLTVTFRNMTIRHGRVLDDAGDSGGGIANSSTSTVSVESSIIENNAALGDEPNEGGGGLLNELGGNLMVSNSLIANNEATNGSGSGGGILNRSGGILTVTNSIIVGNRAARAGGGIEANGSSATLTDVSLLSNHTGANPGNGGGLHSTGVSSVTVTAGFVVSNTATAEGGGLWNSITGTMTIDGVTIVGNIASGKEADQGGGGLFNDGGDLTVMNSVIRGNIADGTSSSGGGILNMPSGPAGSGGGILNTAGGTLIVMDSTIEANMSKRAGGGIEDNASTTTLTNVNLIDNTTGPRPGNGGGFHSTGASNVTITAGKVLRNSAAAEGGGLWNSGAGTMSVDMVLVAGNYAGGSGERQGGGGIFNVGGDLSVSNSTIVENSAMNNGGGIKVIDGETIVTNVTLADNSADGDVSTLVAMTGTITLNNSIVGATGEQHTPLCTENVMAHNSIANLATDESCGASIVATALLGDTTKQWWLHVD